MTCLRPRRRFGSALGRIRGRPFFHCLRETTDQPRKISAVFIAPVRKKCCKPVRFQQIPFKIYKARLLGRGMSEAMAQGLTDMAIAKNEGLDNAEPRTAENTTPTSFRQWCEEMLKPLVLG